MYSSDGNRLINSLRFRSDLEKFSVNVHGYNQLMATYRVYMRLTDETYCVHVEAGRTNLLSHGLAFVWISEFSYRLTLFSPCLSLSLLFFLNSHDTTANVRVTILATKLAYALTKQLGQVFSATSRAFDGDEMRSRGSLCFGENYTTRIAKRDHRFSDYENAARIKVAQTEPFLASRRSQFLRSMANIGA